MLDALLDVLLDALCAPNMESRVVKKIRPVDEPVGRKRVGKLTGRVSWDYGSQRSSTASRSLIAAAESEFRIQPWARDHAAS